MGNLPGYLKTGGRPAFLQPFSEVLPQALIPVPGWDEGHPEAGTTRDERKLEGSGSARVGVKGQHLGYQEGLTESESRRDVTGTGWSDEQAAG